MHPLSEPAPTYSRSLTSPEPAPGRPHSRTDTRAHHNTSGPGGCRRLNCAFPTGTTADENSSRRHTTAAQFAPGLSGRGRRAQDECQYSYFGGNCPISRSGIVGGEACEHICRQHPAGTVASRSGERHVLVIGMNEDRTSGTRREAAIRLQNLADKQDFDAKGPAGMAPFAGVHGTSLTIHT